MICQILLQAGSLYWEPLLLFFFSKPKENDNSGAPQRDMELSPFASSSGGRRRRGRRTEEQPYFRKWPVLITLVITIMSRLELSLQHSSRQALEWEKEAKSEYTFFPLLSPSSGLHRSLLATFTNAAAMAMAHLLALPILVFDKK